MPTYPINTSLTTEDLKKLQISSLDVFSQLVRWGWYTASGRPLQWFDHLQRGRPREG